jgi:hypothetical protein
MGHSPRKRWLSGLNPAGIIIKPNPTAEPCTALNQNGSEHRMVYRAEKRGIIFNGVNVNPTI